MADEGGEGVWNPRRPADTAGPDEKSPAAGSAKEREESDGFREGGKRLPSTFVSIG